MKKFSLFAAAVCGASAFASLHAIAQSVVTDPAATVPLVVYQSVFRESPIGVETKSVDWKKANADVAQFTRGHVDILKWEESQLKGKLPVKPMPKGETKADPTSDSTSDPKSDAMVPKAAQPASHGVHKQEESR